VLGLHFLDRVSYAPALGYDLNVIHALEVIVH
jgi:hypothetical protein